MPFEYFDLAKLSQGSSLESFFHGWAGAREQVVVLSPHDDDALLGAGYLLQAVMGDGVVPYVLIFCNGCAGYSDPGQRGSIVATRRAETLSAYHELGIPEDHIIRFDRPDFSVIPYLGWQLPAGYEGGSEGLFRPVVTMLRDIGATRIVAPNDYREHLDHLAVALLGLFYAPQVGDNILADWGTPCRPHSFCVYSVWADFSPEDALVQGRDTTLRANLVLRADLDAEERVRRGIRSFASQGRVIEDLIKHREGRRTQSGYLELYLLTDPRPILDYAPYEQALRAMAGSKTSR